MTFQTDEDDETMPIEDIYNIPREDEAGANDSPIIKKSTTFRRLINKPSIMSPVMNLANLTHRSIGNSPTSHTSIGRKQTLNTLNQSQKKQPLSSELNQRLEALITKREGNQTDFKQKKNNYILDAQNPGNNTVDSLITSPIHRSIDVQHEEKQKRRFK